MKIISNFSDYYDCIMREGVDPTQVWIRKSEEYNCKDKNKKNYMDWMLPELKIFYKKQENHPYTALHIIGFCGKIYPMIIIERLSTNAKVFCWNMEDVVGFIAENYSMDIVLDFKKKYPKLWGYFYNKEIFERFFKECEEKKDSYEYLFLKYNTPVFVARHNIYFKNIIFNARLKDLDFVKIFDPYQAFQEIQMYFGSKLQGSDGHKIKYKGQMIEPNLDDVTKAESKGFDKWSFRKEK